MQLNGRDPTLVLSNMFSPLEKIDSNGEEDQGVQGNRSDHEEDDLHFYDVDSCHMSGGPADAVEVGTVESSFESPIKPAEENSKTKVIIFHTLIIFSNFCHI